MPNLETELAEKEAQLSQRLEVLEKLEEEALQLHGEIKRHKKMLDVLREIKPPETDMSKESADEPTMSKREIAERILRASLTPLFPRQVRDIAVEKGWLENTPSASNQLTVAINKAFKQNKLAKDDEGRYSMPPRSEPAPEQELLVSSSETQE